MSQDHGSDDGAPGVSETGSRDDPLPNLASADHSASASPQDDPTTGEVWLSRLQSLAFAALVILLGWMAFNVQLPTVSELQAEIESLGWWAWIGFAALYALVAITPIPVTVMAVTAGFAFNIVTGTVLSVIGVMTGSWIAYWIARGLGQRTMRRLLGRHGAMVENRLQYAGFEAVATLRLMPGVPYWPVNYGAGAFGVSHGPYVMASVLSCIPGQFSLVALGAFIANPSVANGVVVGIAWVAVIVLTLIAYRDWRRTRRGSSASRSE